MTVEVSSLIDVGEAAVGPEGHVPRAGAGFEAANGGSLAVSLPAGPSKR